MKCNEAGRLLIMSEEGCKLTAYKCAGGVWSIGYGHTRGIQPGRRCTMGQALAWFEDDLEEAEEIVDRLCPGANGNEFSALVSFAFNIGEPRMATSTLRKLFLKGDKAAAADQFPRWNQARDENGDLQVMPGLVRRRARERALFLEVPS